MLRVSAADPGDVPYVQVRTHSPVDDEYMQFVIGPEGRNVWATWTPQFHTVRDIATLLCGVVSGCILRLRRQVLLHACVVALDGRAMIMAGPERSGKSTLAAEFARQGYAVHADDIAVLTEWEGRWHVFSGPTQVRLCADAAAKYGGGVDLPTTWTRRGLVEDKYLLGVADDAAAHATPLPVQAVYTLRRRGARLRPVVVKLSGAAGLMALAANTYASWMLDRGGQAQEFTRMSRLSRAVPVYSLEPSDGLDHLPQTVRMLVDHASAHTPSG
jgi:hypothetical protein